jgi:hypothetical protein
MVVIAGLASHGCGSSSPGFSPNATTGPSAPATAFVTGLRISGNASLSALGETSQLNAQATYSEGTTKDVASEAQWLSAEPSAISVSSSGVLTVIGFGQVTIRAQYLAKSAQLAAIATPPGTFVAFGRVREPGRGGVDGVRVLDTQSSKSAITKTLASEPGGYSIAGLTNTRLAFEKEAYESRQYDVQRNVQTDVAIQRVIRLSTGDTITPPDLAPHDMSYIVGADLCEACRLIRIANPARGTLQLTVKWTVARTALSLWMGEQRFSGTHPELTADVTVAAGEVVVHVGVFRPVVSSLPTDYVPFTLSTGMK